MSTSHISTVLCVGVLSAGLWAGGVLEHRAAAQSAVRATNTTAAPRTVRSQHFVVHTDLDDSEAKDLLERLETMLGLISTYWQRPLGDVIPCYVVKDLKSWPTGSLPDDYGRAKIAEGAGVTVSRVLSAGDRFVADATVYAVADRGTPQHEAVHAYCAKVFGTTGPVWYSEGMAELGQYWRKNDNSVKVHDVVVRYLRSSEPKSLNGIVNNREATGDSWQNYAWRWALCHLLEFNPNYHSRFRPLGVAILQKKDITFEQVYGDVADEVSFEYLFFLEHLGNGYRVDLCAWDWKKRFVPLHDARGLTARVQANRGWQASGAMVLEGKQYQYVSTGTWKLDPEHYGCDADGDDKREGDGRLMGVVMKDYRLSPPFELGTDGSFVAPSDGKLFLRCRDDWCQLADNKGQVTVKLVPAK